MRTIFKYPLAVDDEQMLALPKGAKLLTVQAQFETPYLWALIDRDETAVDEVRVATRGTGHEIRDDDPVDGYLGSYQLRGGNFVGHVFAERERIRNGGKDAA